MDGDKESHKAKYTLRGYQQDAVQSFLKDLEDNDSVAAVLPTGSGKSIIIIDLIDKLRPKLGIDGSILILCHLTDPLYQLFDSYKSLGERPARQIFWKRLIPGMNIDMIYTTMQKMARQSSIDLWRHHMKQSMVRKPKYIIIDEAHSYGAPSYRKMRDLFPDAKLIGLSATPFRSNKYSFSQFEIVTYTRSMSELIDLGFLTPPKTETVTIPKEMDSDGGRIALSYQIWSERESKRGLVTVVYFPTTDIAKSALASFTQQNHARCAYIDGSTHIKDAKKILSDARDGKYDILINCQKLETGVDIPNIGSVIMPYPCGSVTRYMQRVGRALRLFPGKDHAKIYLCGNAPAIESGEWLELHNQAIRARDPLPSECLIEELTSNEDLMKNKVKMEWTRQAIEACKLLETDGLITLSKFLAAKKFPKKYDKFINNILSNAKPSQGYNDSPISQIQSDLIIKRYKMEERHVKQLTKNEASALINGMNAHLDSDPFIFRDGPHMGKHPSELHPLARSYCTGETKKKLQAWWRAGRPEKRG